jgi:hypothetical protein
MAGGDGPSEPVTGAVPVGVLVEQGRELVTGFGADLAAWVAEQACGGTVRPAGKRTASDVAALLATEVMVSVGPRDVRERPVDLLAGVIGENSKQRVRGVPLPAGGVLQVDQPRAGSVQVALLQCGCGVGQYLFGQVGVVEGSGYGDRADEGTEAEDRFAFCGSAVGAAGELGQHGEAFPYLAGVGGPGRAVVAGGVRGDAGHAAA